MNYSWNWSVLWQSTGVGDSTYLQWGFSGSGLVVGDCPCRVEHCHGFGQYSGHHADLAK